MTPAHGRADRGDHCLTWSNPVEGVALIVRGVTARTAAPIAIIVGTVLSLVNQGQIVASGQAGVTTWIRVGINYAIPFIVASIGYIAPLRRGHRLEAETPVDCDELDHAVRPKGRADKSDLS